MTTFAFAPHSSRLHACLCDRLFSIRKCADDATPQLEAESVAGLTILNGVDSPTAGDAVVTRVSGTQATVLIKANSFAEIAPGYYISELRELTAAGKNALEARAALGCASIRVTANCVIILRRAGSVGGIAFRLVPNRWYTEPP